jgi:hypothetical protein
MKWPAISLLAFVLTRAGACLAGGTDDPGSIVAGFYGAYATFHPSDGIPDAQGRTRYEPFISPSLDKLLIDGNAAEEKFAAKNKDSPPLIEGDLFTSNFEGATSYKVGPCKTDAKAAQCTVALTYSDGKDKPVQWSDTVYLVATPSGWRVDDIGYGANWAFANRGRLTGTLSDAIANAGE